MDARFKNLWYCRMYSLVTSNTVWRHYAKYHCPNLIGKKSIWRELDRLQKEMRCWRCAKKICMKIRYTCDDYASGEANAYVHPLCKILALYNLLLLVCSLFDNDGTIFKEPYLEMLDKKQSCIHPNFCTLPSLNRFSRQRNPIFDEMKFGSYDWIDEFVHSCENLTLNRLLVEPFLTEEGEGYIKDSRIVLERSS